jgi:hypothetical protein
MANIIMTGCCIFKAKKLKRAILAVFVLVSLWTQEAASFD